MYNRYDEQHVADKDNRNYKYRRPIDQKQQIEAIYEELAINETSDRRNHQWTIKSLLQKIEHRLSEYIINNKSTASREQWLLESIVISVGVFATLLVFIGAHNDPMTFLRPYQFACTLWGLSLAAIYVGIILERSAFVSTLWQFSSTKIISTLAFSTLIVVSTGKSASIINSLFGIDATNMPLTLTIITGIIALHYLKYFLFLVLIVSLAHITEVFNYLKELRDTLHNEFPTKAIFFIILSWMLAMKLFSWSSDEFNEERLREKSYILSHQLDFNNKHTCSNLEQGTSVVYLGNSQNIVLADENKVNINGMKDFFNGHVNIPYKFEKTHCE